MTYSIRSKIPIACMCAALFLPLAGVRASAQDASSKPDNSAQNANQITTAQDQSSAKSDRELTAKIRRAIIADTDLSLYAHNVKIITRNGTVTLKGPVKSADEKQKLENDAAALVARESLVDNITVKE
jgi:hyperosmotically inducible protein